MAGQPKRRAMIEELSKRATETFDTDPVDVAIGTQNTPTHLDYVSAWIERGQTVKALAQDITNSIRHEITYDQLMRYLRSTFGDQQTERELDAARTRASHLYAEHALEIVDAPAYDSVSVQQAATRAKQRNWLAERYNPSRFGQAKGPTVSISIGGLHLQALQAIPNIVTGSAQTPSIGSGEQASLPIQVVEP